MNQYQAQNAAMQIDGYYIHKPSDMDNVQKTFDNAKAECVKNLQEALANVEGMTLEQFLKHRRG